MVTPPKHILIHNQLVKSHVPQISNQINRLLSPQTLPAKSEIQKNEFLALSPVKEQALHQLTLSNEDQVGISEQIQFNVLSNNSIPITIDSNQYENIRNQLHEARIENASNRADKTRLNREKLELKSRVKQQAKLIF